MADPAWILVVDDEPYNRDVLEQELDALGHRSVLAADGRQALERLAERAFDVILLDIMMPVMDGFAVLDALRRADDLRDIPVIVISALHDLPNSARAIELGAVDYLPKPFEPVILKARLDACIERRRWRLREQAYLAEIDARRRTAESLLHVLMPADAVTEWQQTGSVAPRQLQDVAVMFLDIVGFSRSAEQRSATTIVQWLTAFTEGAEELAAKHRLEKIKLVGDAVMVTGNLLVANKTPVPNCVAYARDLHHLAMAIGDGWRLRGGLAQGPVVAGVIGRERFSYDLWGPTVNLAARLAGLPRESVLNLAIDDDIATSLPGPKAPATAVDLRGIGERLVHRVGLERAP